MAFPARTTPKTSVLTSLHLEADARQLLVYAAQVTGRTLSQIASDAIKAHLAALAPKAAA